MSNVTPTGDSNNNSANAPYQPSNYPTQPYGQGNRSTQPYGQSNQSTQYSYDGSNPSPSSDKKGFFGALFDMSFDYYVTPKIAKLVYIIAIICAAVMWIGSIIVAGVGGAIGTAAGADAGGTGVVVVLIILVGWIPALLFVIGVRMQIEFVLALIKTAENTATLRRKLER
ncbi:DUF4282 domain-containing protein [Cutibacterium equinum]|uniref:DUF4282 domain-containing protein n=1 Tax=Cutibacterium equinum TaxID=3016342 RepID=A0ABY7QZQ6_9ACTN|nr:DUF4282 domain-containing protein [Cutibacterium equinum]WCC79863.1 DUF4282 domain-containing protein [Cutibacterium equinum]